MHPLSPVQSSAAPKTPLLEFTYDRRRRFRPSQRFDADDIASPGSVMKAGLPEAIRRIRSDSFRVYANDTRIKAA